MDDYNQIVPPAVDKPSSPVGRGGQGRDIAENVDGSKIPSSVDELSSLLGGGGCGGGDDSSIPLPAVGPPCRVKRSRHTEADDEG